MSDEEKHVWDRQLGESSKAYAHFCLYRDMGKERSLRKLATDARTTSLLRQLQHWSSRWKWVERCQKYDDYLEYQDRLQQEKERRDMRKRHAKIALLGENIVVKGLENLLGKVQSGDQAVAPADLTRLLDTSVKVERLARGESTENHEVSGPGGGPIEITDALSKLLDKLAR
jgi:chromatin segregation and condensation protein Rec8/ScpA/Scc1 (kleisin family)